MIKKLVTDWVQSFIQQPEYEDCLLIDVVANNGNHKVEVFIDSDAGMSFEKCRKISRHLEEKLDEGMYLGEKYTLEVSSPGAKRPMKYLRQYTKHVSRNLKVVLKNGQEEEGKLIAIQDEELSIEVLRKVEKKKTKEIINIPFSEVEHSYVQLKF